MGFSREMPVIIVAQPRNTVFKLRDAGNFDFSHSHFTCDGQKLVSRSTVYLLHRNDCIVARKQRKHRGLEVPS